MDKAIRQVGDRIQQRSKKEGRDHIKSLKSRMLFKL